MEKAEMGRVAALRGRASLVGVLTSGVLMCFTAAPANAASSGDAPALTPASFSAPPTTVRPCYRWWMPLAYTSDDELRAEIAQMAASGAGCVEVSPFGVPGSGNDTPTFLKAYGWGSPLWAQRMSVIYQAASQYGVGVDMNLGPNYPPTVPTVHDVNDPAAAQQLLYGNTTVSGGSTFSGALPAPSTSPPSGANSELVAVVAGECTQTGCISQPGGSVMLDRSTMRDLTGLVDRKTNTLSWTAPSGSGTWELIDFWQTADGQTKAGMEATTPNYVVDHLSTPGAQALTSFLDTSVLDQQELNLIAGGVRSGIFEDSQELSSNEKWTWDFMSEFRQLRGYDLTTLLPALTGAGAQGTSTPAFDFSDGSGARVRWDYRQTWSDLYIGRYVKTLQDWAAAHGMYFRAQAYGEPIALGSAAETLGVPEGESIDFGSPNSFGVEQDMRVLSAGAHLTGKTRVSEECCGIFLGSYRSTMAGADINQSASPLGTGTVGANDAHNGNLDTIYKGLAGGVTQIVWHGFAYCCAPAGINTSSGTGEGGVWPGYNPWSIFGALDVGEQFGPRLPEWGHIRGVNDNLGRVQLVTRQGQAHPDFAVYYEDLGEAGQSVSPQESPAHMIGDSSASAQAGYTWEYLNPAMLGTSPSVYSHGELFPGRAGYRAFVLNNQPTMPLAAGQQILALARDGLPVVVVGSAPSSTPGDFDAASQDKALQGVIVQLLALSNVKQIASERDLPGTLAGLRVKPAAGFIPATANLETVRRTTPETDYYFLYNSSSSPLTHMVSFAGQGIPLQLDSWAASITPIADYQEGGGRVTIPVTVKPYDQTVIAITRDPGSFGVGATNVHAVSTTAPELNYVAGKLVAQSTTAGTFTTKLSNGETQSTAIPDVPAAINLTRWALRAQTWTPGSTDHDTTKIWQPTFAAPATPDGKLLSWLEIVAPVDLHNASGIGEYTTSVTLPADWTGGHGAYLNLGRVADTVQVTVNGQDVAGLNESNPDHIDVGPYLHTGANTILVRVATTLFNAVQNNALLGHPGAIYLEQPPERTGLMGPIELVPYGRATVT